MRRVGIAILLIALPAGGWILWRRFHQPPPTIRVLLLDPVGGDGLDWAMTQSLSALLVDELETRSDLAVTSLPKLPEPFQPAGDLVIIRPTALREGNYLRLALEWAEVGVGRQGAWHLSDPSPGLPALTLRAAVSNLPFNLQHDSPSLLPEDPDHFWTFLKADSSVYSNVNLNGALETLQVLCSQEPRCALFQASLAHLDTLRILQDSHPLYGHVDMALHASEQALLLLPGYPRALHFSGRLLSDQGHQDEALHLLAEGLHLRPHSLNILFAIDYASRTAGLLDIALGSRERITSLWAISPPPPPTGFTFLYAGRLAEFESSFQIPAGAPLDGFTEFNLGYAALIRNNPVLARQHFLAAEQDQTAEGQFRMLAKVFRFQLEGDKAGAREALDLLDQSRMGLQVPDGEFTFTMSEAAAYLGEEGLAMDLAQRSFSQGFICDSWYTHSPFMGTLQKLPRWKSILQHVEERRGRLAQLHHRADFGL